jgi:hypothetical protein
MPHRAEQGKHSPRAQAPQNLDRTDAGPFEALDHARSDAGAQQELLSLVLRKASDCRRCRQAVRCTGDVQAEHEELLECGLLLIGWVRECVHG